MTGIPWRICSFFSRREQCRLLFAAGSALFSRATIFGRCGSTVYRLRRALRAVFLKACVSDTDTIDAPNPGRSVHHLWMNDSRFAADQNQKGRSQMNSRFSNLLGVLACAAAVGLLASCGGGGGSGLSSGTLGVSLTDAPTCSSGITDVYVTVTGVSVHQRASAQPSDPGWINIVLPTPLQVDLTTLTNGVLESLGTTALPAGQYQQIRLMLASTGNAAPYANYVVYGGTPSTPYPLTVPSGSQTGIKLIGQFTVTANTLADVVLDFDACRSVVSAGNSGKYLLKPVISMDPVVVSGTIDGYVDPTVAASSTSPVTVSAQIYNASTGVTVVKSTVADSTGHFILSPVLDTAYQNNVPYQIVITAANEAAMDIEGVTVGAGATVHLNASSSPITFTTSSMATASGAVTVSNAPSTAAIEAVQSFPNGLQAEIGFTNADSVTGDYSMSLPTAVPLVATFSATTGVGTFAADTTSNAAGAYSLVADAGTGTTQSLTITVPDTAANFSF